VNAPVPRAARRPVATAVLALAGLLLITLAGYALSRLSREAIAASTWLYLLVLVPLTLRWGRNAGLCGVVLSALLIALFVSAPYGSLRMGNAAEGERLAVSLVGMTIVVLLIDSLNRTRAERERLYRREQLARSEADAARQRLTFLAGASAALAASLDTQITLQNLTHLLVPTIGDYCTIDTLEAEGTLKRAAIAIAIDGPDRDALAEALRRSAPDPADERDALVRILRSGEAELQGDLASAGSAPSEREPWSAALPAPRSRILVPLAAHGRIRGVLQVAIVSERAPYGAADLALVKGLASRAALALDNARLYREAQEALQARDEFFSSVTHDLKTPLTAIKGMSQIAHRRLAHGTPLDPEQLERVLSTIDASTERMQAMINDLLDLTRLQTGRPLDLVRTHTDLVALTREAAAEHQRATGRHTIRVESDEDALYGTWDTARLDRVIANLLANAIKYSDGGTIALRLRRESGAEGGVAVLSVQDAGIGIPAADLPYVFERFHRAANVRGRAPGSGIGLAGARAIVEQHGGSISVESREGEGATFTVRLPLQPADVPALGAVG
jgi:signal transduction histidine kinase